MTALGGLGLPAAGLKADLIATHPVTGDAMTVVGVLEKFSWSGGAGDLLKLEFYVSQENATQIKALQQAALKTTHVRGLNWWIEDYDQETKAWFEQAYPASPLNGIIAGKDHPQLDVDLNPVVVKDGIDVNVFKVVIAVSPSANQQYALHFANSSAKKVVKTWGLQVGTLAPGALPA